MIINGSCWNEYQGIKFYDGNNITKDVQLDSDNVVLSADLQEIAKENGYTKAFINRVKGIEFDDDVKIRNARKLNLEKNDIFSLKEGRDSKILYVPTKLEAQGTVKKMESEKGYWLYEKNLINQPILVSVELWKEISKEQADNYCKEWGKPRNGTKFVKLLDDGRYICMDDITVTFPCFSLLTYKESVKSEYGKRLETMVKTIREKAGIHIDEYSLEKILEVYVITPKKQEG